MFWEKPRGTSFTIDPSVSPNWTATDGSPSSHPAHNFDNFGFYSRHCGYNTPTMAQLTTDPPKSEPEEGLNDAAPTGDRMFNYLSLPKIKLPRFYLSRTV